jgi:hypothetical protein
VNKFNLIPEKYRPNPLEEFGPLYHSYSFFGVDNKQIDGIYKPNQIAKSQIITAYIAYALSNSIQDDGANISFAELFCADGYYAMVARNLGCKPCFGIDNNRDKHTKIAPFIAQKLGLDNVFFLESNISPNSKFEKFDIVANIGGLYHTENPEEILKMSFEMAGRYLIIQNVVSLANDIENYFESPAPGWTWGSRYSRKSFDAVVKRLFGPKIILSHFNELTGNTRLEDRGSAYYLIKK